MENAPKNLKIGSYFKSVKIITHSEAKIKTDTAHYRKMDFCLIFTHI